jgi:hypothetical protein
VNPTSKITSSHLSRLAIVYVRQSTVAQVRQNTESTLRQYGLAGTAAELGWLAGQIVVVDADLGVSGRRARRAGYGGSRLRALAPVCCVAPAAGCRSPASSAISPALAL